MNFATTALGGACVAAVLALEASPIAAENWDMPTPSPGSSFQTENVLQFADEVATLTEGELSITVHPADSLYGDADIKDAVRDGRVPIGKFRLSKLERENAVFRVDTIPFLARDYDEAQRLWQASRPVIADLLAREDLLALYAVAWPPGGLYTREAVDVPGDLRGLSFHARDDASERLGRLVGMTPAEVEEAEIADAFAEGRLDAVIASPGAGADSAVPAFAEHYYHLRISLPKTVVVVNQRVFDALDPQVQDALIRAAEMAMDRGWEMSRTESGRMLDQLEAVGVRVHRDPPATVFAAFHRAGARMADDWLEAAGAPAADILKQYEDLR